MKVVIQITDADIFVVADGVTIAKRGQPGTRQAKTWVSLEPGWEVCDCRDGDIEVKHNEVRIH